MSQPLLDQIAALEAHIDALTVKTSLLEQEKRVAERNLNDVVTRAELLMKQFEKLRGINLQRLQELFELGKSDPPLTSLPYMTLLGLAVADAQRHPEDDQAVTVGRLIGFIEQLLTATPEQQSAALAMIDDFTSQLQDS